MKGVHGQAAPGGVRSGIRQRRPLPRGIPCGKRRDTLDAPLPPQDLLCSADLRTIIFFRNKKRPLAAMQGK